MPIKEGDGDPRHGTYSAYQNHRCRCDLCRRANTEYSRIARKNRFKGKKPSKHAAARGATGVPREHNASTYCNWGCRCKTCTADFTRSVRERRQEQRLFATDLKHVCDAPFPVKVGRQWRCPECGVLFEGGEVVHPQLGKALGWSSV